VIDTDKPHLTPMYRPESHLVYAVQGGDVSHVVVGGRVVVEHRELKTLDVGSVMSEVARIAAALVP
jgi:5-methylthioadenosine/S-adenosylhomocysteine deaminase